MTLSSGRVIAALLVALHAGLAAWSVVGLIEWFVAEPPWPRLSNPLLPRPVLLAQWVLVLLAAGVFLAGYARRWPRTPVALAGCYAAMGVLCAVENIAYLGRYVAMAVEYAAYVAILGILFRMEHFRRAFAPHGAPAGPP